MKTKASKDCGVNELQFELKYCERCGGLWLRPAGGEQIFCKACGQGMAELPPASYELQGVASPRLPQGPRWNGKVRGFEDYDEDGVADWGTAGGVA